MSKPLTSRVPSSKGPFPALIPLGKHAGRPAISLRRPITLVGSADLAHVHLSSQSVDPTHALLVLSDGRLYVRDLASHAGVQVNDEPVLETELAPDDVLKIGSFQFRLSIPTPTPEGREPVPPATFTLDGQLAGMDGHVLLIGRRSSCDLVVTDPKASRIHAAVVAVNGQYVVRDLGSRAGTLVNTDKVHEHVLESGDEIHVASHAIFFQSEAATAATASDESADLVDLDDSLLAANPMADAAPDEPAVAAAAAAAEEPDALDLDLPGIDEPAEASPLDLDDAVPLEGAADEPEPAAESPAAAADEEDQPIPLDLDLDLSTPDETTPEEALPPAEAAAAEPEPEPTPSAEGVATEDEPAPLPESDLNPTADETPIPVDVAEPEPPAHAEPEDAAALPLAADDDTPEPAPPVLTEPEEIAPEPLAEEPLAEIAPTAPPPSPEDPATQERFPSVHSDATSDGVTPSELPSPPVTLRRLADEGSQPLERGYTPDRADEESQASSHSHTSAEDTPAEVPDASADDVEIPVTEATDEPHEPAAAAEALPEIPPDDDLLRLVAEEIGEQQQQQTAPPATDDLSKTPFAMAAEDEPALPAPDIEPAADETPPPPHAVEPVMEAEPEAAESDAQPEPDAVAESNEPTEEPSLGFGFGANQHFSLVGSPVDWPDAGSLGPLPPTGPLFEISLAGVHGAVEGVEPLPETPDAPTEVPPDAANELVESAAEPQAETQAEPAAQREQLLGFIRVDEVSSETTPPLPQRGPIEPVRSVVEPAGDAAPTEPTVDLPLETGQPQASSSSPAPIPPSPVSPPDGLHAVPPPRKAFRITRGLSSLTAGGRAVDVFSQLPLVSDDPVLGKVAGPAQIPSEEDPALSAEPPAPPPPPPPTQEELSAALSPNLGGFDSPDTHQARPGEDAPQQSPQPLFIRKLKRMFRERGGTLSIAAAMLAAGAVAYALTPSPRIVRAEVHYRNFTHLPAPAQRALAARQRALLTDPAVLASAADAVTVGPGAPGPGFLASPVAASRLVDRADADLWPANQPGTLALTLRSSDPDADAERLRALTAALVDAPANRRLAAAAQESAARADRARSALASLDQDIDRLRQEQVAAQARLASADARGTDDLTTALPDPAPVERAWRTASLAALRAQADVQDLTDRKVPPTDPRMTAARSRLAAARATEAAARDRFVASQSPPPATRTDVSITPERRAAEVAASLRTLQSRRTTAEADLKQLQSTAAAAAYPDPPKDSSVWTIPLPTHRNLYTLAAATTAGLSLAAYRSKHKKIL